MFFFKGKKKAATPARARRAQARAAEAPSDGRLVGLDFQDLPDGSVQLALGLGFPDGQDITMHVVRAQ